jgi:hypothetical protein
VVAIVLLVHAATIISWNFSIFQAVLVTAILILVELPQPGNFGAEGYRLLWTLCGVAMATVVVLLAALIARLTAKAPPRPA